MLVFERDPNYKKHPFESNEPPKELVMYATIFLIDITTKSVLTIVHDESGRRNGPGGKVEAHHANSLETAFEECEEEVGIRPEGPGFLPAFRLHQRCFLRSSGIYGLDNLYVAFTNRRHNVEIKGVEKSKVRDPLWIPFRELPKFREQMYAINYQSLIWITDFLNYGYSTLDDITPDHLRYFASADDIDLELPSPFPDSEVMISKYHAFPEYRPKGTWNDDNADLSFAQIET